MNSQLTLSSVNETDTFSVSDEIRQIVGAFVDSAPITQEEVDKHLKVPSMNAAEAAKSIRASKSSSAVTVSGSSSSSTLQLEQPFTSAASSSCGLNSSSGSIGSSARGNKRSGGRTFINRRFNKTQLRELLDNPDEQLGHVTGSFGSFSPPQHPPRHKSLSPTPILPLASLQPIGCVPPPPRLSDRMDTFRRQLPTWALREHILRTIEESPVTLITGGTGCGKTTQVPQFLLESAAQRHCPIRILCTQPRRLPAIAVAKRVAIERGERLGTTVGYHIRLESNCSSETVLTYCTSGVLLRKLTADEWANEATHVILDEIHERETNTDYLLIALRQALKKRKDLKVVLMSATMGDNRAKFMQYFHETGIKCVEVPAQLFSVEVYHLAEALAMTGYMPHSQYGGMFDERAMNLPPPSPLPFYNTFAVPQQQSQCHFVDPFYNSPWRLNSFGPNVPPVQPQMQTVPPDPFISSTTTAGAFASDGFALWRDRRSFPPAVPDIRQKLNIWLMDRPAHFLPHYAPRVREVLNRCIPEKELIDAYLDAGGRQWQDSVDGDLVAELICYLIDCQKEGGILVFLPGYDDIMAVSDRINAMQNEGRFARRVRLYTLHSQINTDRQQNVFERVKNEDWERKVVLSTNIAEASLTIDDIVFVIDCGKAKMKGYDHNTRVSQLKCQPIAKSNAEQRKGRAGRCRPGFCFRLYSHEEFIKMDDNQIPEMMRSAIHEVCLHAKMFAPGNLTVQQFLKLAPDPPADEIVENSLLFLEQLGALYRAPLPVAPPPPPPPDTFLARCPRRPRRGISRFESLGAPVNRRIQLYCPSSFDSLCHWLGVEEASLTELGRTIAHLPLEPQPARLLLFGIALRCVGPVLTLVAALSHRDPFVLAVNEDQKQKANTIKDEFSLMDFSDHLMLIRAFNAYQRVYGGYREQWCWDRMLSESGMRMIGGIRHQLFVELRRLRLLPSQMSNADDDVNGLNLFSVSWPMVQGCIVAGTYPNIGFVRLGTKLNRIRTVVAKNCVLHPGSSLKRQTANPSRRSEKLNEGGFGQQRPDPKLQYLSYQELVGDAHQQHMVRTVTAVPPLHILLFAGPIRMDPKCVKHYELVDPDGSLKTQRKSVRDKMLRKYRKEQRSYERTLRQRHKEQLERRKESEQKLEEQKKRVHEKTEKQRKRQRERVMDEWDQALSGPWEESADGQSSDGSRQCVERKEQQTTDSAQRLRREGENEENGVSDENSDDSYDSFPAADPMATPSSLSSSALSSLDPELAEEMPDYLRSLPQREPEESLELLELDHWFAFRGTFNDLQMMMKLRFRLMDYFTRVLSHSVGRELSPEDRRLLDCLNETLTEAHRSQHFAKVNDLGRQNLNGSGSNGGRGPNVSQGRPGRLN